MNGAVDVGFVLKASEVLVMFRNLLRTPHNVLNRHCGMTMLQGASYLTKFSTREAVGG
ncbi:hypothetical protein KC19_VG062800 [Ceratodon purpureus]|uniref:Uncharacterized protein n=1 Tax=Ceratodon purpureus TaxID=3225 RepID=A0A8T0HMJ0_CERPU|nr:hypothetical protein KC19_VG062800 [Ceratodon purpureus]